MGIHQLTIARYAVIVLSGNMTFVLREEGERGFASNSFQKYKYLWKGGLKYFDLQKR